MPEKREDFKQTDTVEEEEQTANKEKKGVLKCVEDPIYTSLRIQNLCMLIELGI